VTRQIPDRAIELLTPHAEIDQWPKERPMLRHELLGKVAHASAILSCLTERIDEPVFRAAGPQLKIVANYAVGFDNIDLDVARQHGVAVTNTPGVLTEAVAEHALALIFAVARRVVEGDAFVRAGRYEHWLPLGFLGPQLWGKTIGIVGLGRIGGWVAEMAVNGLRMMALYAGPHRDRDLELRLGLRHVELPTLMKQSDVVTLHTPLTEQTHHLIGRRELALMKRTAILVNTSRGLIVDEAALTDTLSARQIFGAGLDVFEHEPTVSAALRKLPNVVLTPHIASATHEARTAMAEIAAKNILAVLAGKPPLNPVRD
jgi:glyoxylate reductase